MCSEVRPLYAFFETIFLFFVYKNRKNIVNRQCVVKMRKKAIGAAAVSEYAIVFRKAGARLFFTVVLNRQTCT